MVVTAVGNLIPSTFSLYASSLQKDLDVTQQNTNGKLLLTKENKTNLHVVMKDKSHFVQLVGKWLK